MIPAQLYWALPYIGAFALAVAIPVIVVLQYRLAATVSSDVRLRALLALIAFGALLTVLLTPRDLNEQTLIPRAQLLLTDLDDSFAASRYLNILVISFSFAESLRGWLAARAAKEHDPARPILYGIIAFYFGTIAIQALGSAHPAFSYKSFYVPVVMLAVYYQRIVNIEDVLGTVKWVIFALMSGSLLGMLLKPDFVLHRPDPTILPGVDFRLFGLTPHANALGPMALIALLLEIHFPSRRRTVRWLQALSAAAVLVLAQSKTSWIAGLAAFMLVGLPVGLMPSREPAQRNMHFQRSVATSWVFILVAIAIAVVLSKSDILGHFQDTVNVHTLTGRTQIWELTLDGWRENPLLGYGRDIWGRERMLKFNMLYVGQAHNQVIQTLGDSGLVGLLVMLAFLGVLLHAGLSAFAASRGLTMSLLVVVVVRCFTEAPLRPDGALTWPTFTLVLLLLVACYFVRLEARVRPETRSALRTTTHPLGTVAR